MWLLVISMSLYANLDALPRRGSLLLAATASVLAVVVHRVGVTMIGMNVPEYPPYRPLWLEVVMAIGLLALGLLAYRLIVHYLPVYDVSRQREMTGQQTTAPVLHEARADA
jgi:Ni/Fe-hydrogenase subunit HybB-like protein